jgi:hypothetical protein
MPKGNEKMDRRTRRARSSLFKVELFDACQATQSAPAIRVVEAVVAPSAGEFGNSSRFSRAAGPDSHYRSW